MDRIPIWVLLIMFFFLFSIAKSKKDEVKQALVQFMEKLNPDNTQRDPKWGWNASSDPCIAKWQGVTCDSGLQYVRKIVLDRLNLTGVFDAESLCVSTSLLVVNLNGNNLSGEIHKDISKCRYITHMYLSGNDFSGSLPVSLSNLSNLKRLDISDNHFSGELPDLLRISGLLSLFAQNNELNGQIPKLDFSNLINFNVSYNNFSGPIPDVKGLFNETSFLGNPQLCGKPISKQCPMPKSDSKKSPNNQFLIYSGYAMIVLVVFLLVGFKVIKRNKAKDQKAHVVKTTKDSDYTFTSSRTLSEFKTAGTKSEYSITSVESGRPATSMLVVLKSPVEKNGLTFEGLLRAPAELMGRGKNGSLYKVKIDSGVTLAVKRITNWGISRGEFKKRMEILDEVKHPKVLPVVAYYCSKKEKLLVYEFQQNGSLFKLLHGSQDGQLFDWGSRLSVAAKIAEGLAFMHNELNSDMIPHGNLKSSNILLNNDMDPCISEYGLTVIQNHETSFKTHHRTFKEDIYGFGVILLELLTGQLVENNGFDLATWVHSVVKEEWTVEVFDKALLKEGASEERMVNLLQVALKCINSNISERPSIVEVVEMVNSIKEDEERSESSSPW